MWRLMGESVPFLHRKPTNSLIYTYERVCIYMHIVRTTIQSQFTRTLPQISTDSLCQWITFMYVRTLSSASPLRLPPKNDPPIMCSLITHCCKCCWQIPSVSEIFLSSTIIWVTYGFTLAREKSKTVSDIFSRSRCGLQFFNFGIRCMNKRSAASTQATQGWYLQIWIHVHWGSRRYQGNICQPDIAYVTHSSHGLYMHVGTIHLVTSCATRIYIAPFLNYSSAQSEE